MNLTMEQAVVMAKRYVDAALGGNDE